MLEWKLLRSTNVYLSAQFLLINSFYIAVSRWFRACYALHNLSKASSTNLTT